MGRFLYGIRNESVNIDDRALAHIRLVVSTKLRRNEPFLFTIREDVSLGGRKSFWLDRAIPMVFAFQGSRPPSLNGAWVELLMESANSADGLHLVPEPEGNSAPR